MSYSASAGLPSGPITSTFCIVSPPSLTSEPNVKERGRYNRRVSRAQRPRERGRIAELLLDLRCSVAEGGVRIIMPEHIDLRRNHPLDRRAVGRRHLLLRAHGAAHHGEQKGKNEAHGWAPCWEDLQQIISWGLNARKILLF
jgi:hypothetical protein